MALSLTTNNDKFDRNDSIFGNDDQNILLTANENNFNQDENLFAANENNFDQDESVLASNDENLFSNDDQNLFSFVDELEEGAATLAALFGDDENNFANDEALV